MIRKSVYAALLAGSALAYSTGAMAQDAPAAEQPDQSDATADQAIAAAQPIDELQSKIELLQAQVEALQDALEGVKAAQVKVTPSWKGGPLLEDKEAGWSFKPRGRIQYDVGYTSNPDDAIVTRNLGFNTRVRRIRLGAEGTIPGGFGYKFEMDFANAGTAFGDAIITYAPANKPFSFTIGNHESLDGLEQITSSRFTSFMERAAFNDAFINARRIGLSAGYANKAGTFRANAGLYAAHSIDGTLDNDGWIGAARAVYSPLWNGNQMHFGLNFQHREFQSNNGSTAASSVSQPSVNQIARYRARPFTQLTDVRFVDTGNFAAKSDDILGAEVIGIFKSLHVTAEGQWLKANAYDAGDTVTFNPLTDDPVDALGVFAANQAVPTGNPSFWGGYVEAGYYFTGETRGYKGGLWDRTKVLKPFSKGGWGALQLNGRVDYLDLDSNKLKNGCTNNFATGACSLASLNTRLGRGGKQLGFLASLVWIPEDYMRFYLQYAHADITGGPQAALVDPTSSKDVDDRKYGVDSVGMRAQVDF
jgi:phosphate-selective porin OprO and OprP